MTEPIRARGLSDGDRITLVLDAEEADLVRTALKLLEGTLGREEADELREDQALIRKLAQERGR